MGAVFRFSIPDDEEMVAGVDRIRTFLSRYNNPGYAFSFTGKGLSKAGNVCEVELEFDDPKAGEEARALWLTYRDLKLGKCDL